MLWRPQGLEGGGIGGVWARVWWQAFPIPQPGFSEPATQGDWARMGSKNLFKPDLD